MDPRGGLESPGSISRRMRGSPCTTTWLAPIVRRPSISTGAACRSSKSSPSPTSGPPPPPFFSRLRAILVALGVNDGNMEEGSLRCDANVSVRPTGEQAFGVKVELKNLNSFRHVQRAPEHEIARHHRPPPPPPRGGGGRVPRGPRRGNTAAGETVSMRTKEEADDYRYFPEPDL